MINLPQIKATKSSVIRGSPEDNLCVLRYLNRYKDACIILPYIKGDKPSEHRDVSLRWCTNANDFIVPDGYWQQFTKCINKRFIVFPFGFDCSNSMGHANYMLYDRETQSLERFEPYGKSERICVNPVNLDIKLKSLFKKNLGDNFIKKYYSPLDFLSRNGIQKIQEKEGVINSSDPKSGYCSTWCCWYIETRLLNPSVDRKDIISTAKRNIKGNLTEYIRQYSSFVAEFCKRR